MKIIVRTAMPTHKLGRAHNNKYGVIDRNSYDKFKANRSRHPVAGHEIAAANEQTNEQTSKQTNRQTRVST